MHTVHVGSCSCVNSSDLQFGVVIAILVSALAESPGIRQVSSSLTSCCIASALDAGIIRGNLSSRQALLAGVSKSEVEAKPPSRQHSFSQH